MGGPGWKTSAKIAGVPDEYQQMAREEQVKHKRASERLDRDCLLACQPQIDTPFSSPMDALERLLPFHVFYNDNDDELALLVEKEMPKGDPAKIKLNTRNVKNDEKYRENQALLREAWREKQEARGEATTKRLLDVLEKCESAAKRLYVTDELRAEERLFIETLLRDEEKALAPPTKGLRTARTTEVKAPQ